MRIAHILFVIYQIYQHRAALAHAVQRRLAQHRGKKAQKNDNK